MSPRSLAVALAVLLTVSALFALVPFSAHGASGSATPTVRTAADPPAIAATVLDGFDVPTATFYLGAVGYGDLYFIVNDPLDHAVNVTITDQNAARDGIGTPAYSYMATVNTTTHTFDSYTSGVFYRFPSTVPYAGHWTVNFSAPSGGTVLDNVSLLVYSTVISTTVGTSATLPAQAYGVFWSIVLDSNMATLYTHATTVTMYGSYFANGTLASLFGTGGVALTPASRGYGEWTGVVPANTEPNTQLRIEVSAVTNVSGTVVENESANITVNVGALVIHGIGITGAPPNCALVNDVFFTTGSIIASCIQVGSSYHGAFTAVSGLPITVAYWNGTAHVTPVGAPTALTSNVSGEAAFTFVGNAPPFTQLTSAFLYDALNFSVSVPGAGTFYTWTVWSNDSWSLEPATATGVVLLTLDHTTYYVGATASATWSVSSTNLTKTGPLTAYAWQVTGPSAITYEEGVLNSTGSTGTFSFPVLESMAPHTIHVTVYVANATEAFAGAASAVVITPTLALTPASYYYDAGSTASVGVTLNGGGSGAVIQYQAWQYWATTDMLLANGTVANGSSISLAIPSNAPPLAVVVDVWASLGGQVVATNSVNLLLAQGYSIELGVSTVSSYSDGSFQPGQTVTVTYQVVPVGGAPLPQTMSFELFAIGYPYIQVLQKVSPSGSVPFKIPSSAPQGTIIIEILALGTLTGGTCFPTGTCDGLAALYVNPSPSVLTLELAPGSGVTVGWLILLILVVVVAVVLFFVFRRRGGGRVKSMPTTSGASSAPPQEWKGPTPSPPPAEPPAPEPTSTDSSPPPLPPAGAT
jgi:hypothetical protein